MIRSHDSFTCALPCILPVLLFAHEEFDSEVLAVDALPGHQNANGADLAFSVHRDGITNSELLAN